MNPDLKKIMTWVFTTIFGILLALIVHTGQRIIDGQDRMNTTLTTILITQQDQTRRITTLETRADETDARFKANDETVRDFWQNYNPPKRHDSK